MTSLYASPASPIAQALVRGNLVWKRSALKHPKLSCEGRVVVMSNLHTASFMETNSPGQEECPRTHIFELNRLKNMQGPLLDDVATSKTGNARLLLRLALG